MHCLIDAVGVRAGSSAVVLEHLIAAWHELDAGDRLSVVTDAADAPFDVPAAVAVRRVGSGSLVGRVSASSTGLRTVAGSLGADAVLSGNPGTGLLGAPCPRAAILHDLRHEQRPDQFSPARRLARRATWGASFRTADVLLCVSDRTRADLAAHHPRAAAKAVTMHLGADHVDAWAVPGRADHVLAFGHFVNKNVDKVLAAWPTFHAQQRGLTLALVGVPEQERAAVREQIDHDRLAGSVRVMPWLSGAEFRTLFAGARLVVLPSDFEGFGLPAVEALRLGIRLVISSDPALREVTGGHGTVAPDLSPVALANAMSAALAVSDAEVEAGRHWAAGFRWHDAAGVARSSLQRLLGHR